MCPPDAATDHRGSALREHSFTVDVRVIAASNRDLSERVASGELREDLLYRLNVFPIEVPPLRERAGDVTLLAERFLEELNRREGTTKRFTPRTLANLEAHSWPGNARELKNMVERLWILADTTLDVSAPTPAGAPVTQDAVLDVPVGSSLADAERRLILATLDSLDGNKKRAAEQLGISLKTLYNRLAVYSAESRGSKT